MKIHSERALEIDSYIKSHPEKQIGKWPIEIAGEKHIVSYYRFPMKLLRYNVQNGRLAMEVQEWESNHQRKLDTSHKGDLEIIRGMLLNLDITETDRLRDDLHNKGQMEPGVITYDGAVINGNRRMAILETLHKDEPTGKWEFLEAVRLPEQVGPKDLWKIEAGLQLSKGKVAEYHPVNELLKIKQGIDAGLSPSEVAAAMYGRSVDYVKDSIDRLNYIELFLEFRGEPGNYGFIKRFGLHEYFIDLQKNVVAPWKSRDLPKAERNRELHYAFALIDAAVHSSDASGKKKRGEGITHWQFRSIGKIFADTRAKSAFLEHLEKVKDVKSLHKVASEASDMVIDDFKEAQEIIKNREDRDKPLLLIERAMSALESIDEKSEHLGEQRVIAAWQKLLKRVQDLEHHINKRAPKGD